MDIKKTLTAATFDNSLGCYPLLLSSSPNGAPSIFQMGLDALAWYAKIVSDHPVLRVLPNVEEKKERSFRKAIFRQSALIRFSEALGDMSLYTDITKIFHNVVHKYLPMEGMINKTRKIKGKKVIKSTPFKKELWLGKLSLKPEPAGKLRVFAMVDYFTQRALLPLHDWLFDQLRKIDPDGSFDQGAKVQYLSTLDSKVTFSFDLKSATDLIPIQLYESLLKFILGPELAKDWSYLISDRDFRLPRSYPGSVRYSRGQPMGAYSSWAMLASVHHLIVQFAQYINYLMSG